MSFPFLFCCTCMLFIFPRFLNPVTQKSKPLYNSYLHKKSVMYPKVKVRVQKEEDDQYVYEKSSLESLKAFDWLSLNHFSSPDEAPGSVARVPRSYVPKSPIRNFLASTEETNKPKKTVVEESPKNVRATSAPRSRPRAVLSSPVNDILIGSKTQTRRELLSGVKDRKAFQNRHTLCKIFSKSVSVESSTPAQGHKKEPAESKNDVRAKGRTVVADSIKRAGHRKKITPSTVQS